MRILIPLLCVLPLSSAAAEGNSFFETFDTLNTKRWFLSDGWSNGRHQSCVWSKDNGRLVDGKLELMLTDTPRGEHAFSCGELQSHGAYGYGTYEVRMRPAPLASGIVSAFFTYTGPPHGNPHDEIDFEFIAERARSVDASYHAKGNGGRSLPVSVDYDPRSGFHDYVFHWTPDRMTWFANGKVLREVARSEVKEYPTVPGKIYASVWSGSADLNAWLGPFNYPGTPLVASYEHIAYTKLGEDCQFPESIVCKLGKEGLNRQ